MPAVDRAARALDAVAEAAHGLTLSELSRVVGAPKSSLLAVCSSLVLAGMLVRRGGRYELGPALLRLGSAYLARLDLASEFRRLDVDVAPLPEETIVLSRLEGTQTHYLATRPGRRPVAISYQSGLRLPAHCTASGKSQLALLGPSEVEARYAAAQFERLTDRSIDSLEALLADLERTRARGFATDDEETARGMFCVGAAVTDATGRPVAALSVSMVKAAVEESDVARNAAAVRALADDLTLRTGAG